MPQVNLSKKMKKEIRELSGIAHDREFRKNLEELALRFDAWKCGEIDDYQLNEDIHEYHDGIARETWKAAQYSDGVIYIVRAVNHGYLSTDELPPGLIGKIKHLLDIYQTDEC